MNDNVLECKGVSKHYKGIAALDEVNISLKSGSITGLLGPNGSGKTTFIKLVNGLLQPSAGNITVCGMPIGPESKALVSYLPDRVCLDSRMKVEDAMDFYADFYDDFDRDTAVKMIKNLSLDYTKRLKSFSKGNQEKVQLILVMSRRAQLYLLDEPIGGVDPAARDYILNTILSNYSGNATVLISTHLIQDVEQILNDIIFLKEGKVVLEGNANDIRAEKNMSIDSLFREVFRC
ncbi:MAG: ABC transporter ATP-binding protein [Treponema sp.]|jgi:ABC-2 type transport system ATP-binding protein|nr:ABC transporter ATP-binding protein [Treponema sp.]